MGEPVKIAQRAAHALASASEPVVYALLACVLATIFALCFACVAPSNLEPLERAGRVALSLAELAEREGRASEAEELRKIGNALDITLEAGKLDALEIVRALLEKQPGGELEAGLIVLEELLR